MTRAPLTPLLVLVFALALPTPTPVGAQQRVDGVAAVVDDQVILRSEVDSAMGLAIENLKQRGAGEIPPEVMLHIRSQAVESLIAERLILNEADRVGMAATPEDIDAAVEGIATQEGVDAEAIYAAAEAQGLPRERYRTELGNQITRMKVVGAAVRARVNVSDEDVRELFNERYGSRTGGMYADVRHILVPWPPADSGIPRDETYARIDKILEALNEGENFGMLAQRFSVAPSASDGGRMTLRQGESNPDMERFAFTLDPGEVSPPIATSHGLNLIQVLERFDPSSVQYEDVEPDLRAEIISRRMEPKVTEWVGELRERVYVEVVAPDLK